MRQNRRMPRLARPPQQPADVARASQLLGNFVRLELLHELRLRGAATTAELVVAVGASVSQVSQHLAELRRAGVVVGDECEYRGLVRTTRWRLDDDAVAAHLDRLYAYTLGPRADRPAPALLDLSDSDA